MQMKCRLDAISANRNIPTWGQVSRNKDILEEHIPQIRYVPISNQLLYFTVHQVSNDKFFKYWDVCE